MARIRDSHPKQSGGGYERLVGNAAMASIFTKAQSTVITNGTELEKIISGRSKAVQDLDRFIDDCDNGRMPDGAYLCTKRIVKSSRYWLKGHEPDFVIFTIDGARKVCYVVELKDGDAFDTKKSMAEKETLRLFVNHLAPKVQFATHFYICCFNQMDKDQIVTGFKSVFGKDEVMTGIELCRILGIDYGAIVAMRRNDASDNFRYVVEKMFEIKDVRSGFSDRFRRHILEDEFYGADGADDSDD